MTINNRFLKPDIRHATRRWTAMVSSLPLIALIAGVVAAFAIYAPGLGEQRLANTSASDKHAITRTLVTTEGVEHLDRLAREPMVVELSDGTLFVSGYDNNSKKSPGLWRSRDHGATWESVNVGSQADGAIGDSDVDLAVGPDDTLYFAVLTYDVKKEEGVRIAVGASKNAGAKWSWKVLSENSSDDRPWVGVTPDRTAHVIWSDGSGVRYAVSQDGGASWSLRSPIHEQGGSSHLAIGPHGEIAVRVTPSSAGGSKFTPGVDLIAVSRDGGKTWQKHPAPGERDWSPDENKGTPRWVEPLAWDEDGALYSLWGSQKGLWLARSPDQGRTWTSWHIVDRDEVSYFPYLTARGHGVLAATWFTGKDDDLRAHVATIRVGARKAPPQVVEAQPFQTTHGPISPLDTRRIRLCATPAASTCQSVFFVMEAWESSPQSRISARSVRDLNGGSLRSAEATMPPNRQPSLPMTDFPPGAARFARSVQLVGPPEVIRRSALTAGPTQG